MLCVIVGTKAELIKTMPLLKEMDRRGEAYTFVHTGQHKIDDALSEFGLKQPDMVLYEPPRLSSRFMTKTHKAIFWGLMLVPRIRKAVRALGPDYVVYHGDTLSAAAAAVATSRLLNPRKPWLNCHLEAGLRSGSIFEPFPEEISRVICDRFSDILFAVSPDTKRQLERENQRGDIYMVGNTIVDSVLMSIANAKRTIKRPKGRGYVVVNIHRHENIKSRKRMESVVNIVRKITLPVYWPMHDNTKKQLKGFGLWHLIDKPNIRITKLKNYTSFLWLLLNSRFILTDGGSIQEESLALKKPCIILRERTERKEGLSTGLNFLTGLDEGYATEIINELEGGSFKVPKFTNPYGDGKTAERICNIICRQVPL